MNDNIPSYRKLIQQNEERERQEPTADENVIIKSREATPKLLHTVLQVSPGHSMQRKLSVCGCFEEEELLPPIEAVFCCE